VEEAEVLAGLGVVEGEERLELGVVEHSGGLTGGASGIDEGHGPVFELTLEDGFVLEEFDLAVAGVAGDGREDRIDVLVFAFEDLEKRSGVVEEHARELIDGVAGTGTIEQHLEVVFGEGTRGYAGVDELLHGWSIGGVMDAMSVF
jgi:hypothetical protein